MMMKKVLLILIAFTCCTDDNIKEKIEYQNNNDITELNQKSGKTKLFADFDFFTLNGKTQIDKNAGPLIKVSYDSQGRVAYIQDSLGGNLGASPLVFNYTSELTSAKLQSPPPNEYVNLIFTDSVIVALYSCKGYVPSLKEEAFYLNRVHVIRRNLSEDVYYFKPMNLIVKNDLDFKFEYLTKCKRKDSRKYKVDKNKLIINTKSTLDTENKTSCYVCEIPFSQYWWFFYEKLMYPEADCGAK